MVSKSAPRNAPRVSITVFNTVFRDLLAGHAQDLKTLEDEGTVYHEFADSDDNGQFTGSFTRYRIKFTPAEIVEYVQAMIAMQQFDEALGRTGDLTAAVLAINDERFRERVASYHNYGKGLNINGKTVDIRGCLASFVGSEMEDLVCGHKPDRYEPAALLGSNSNKNELIIRALRSIAVSARRLSNRSQGRTDIPVENEYDVQDLAGVALRALFPDVEREDWTPRRAGMAKRIDLVIPSASTVVECKFVRDPRHARTIADELRIDFECYHDHRSCRELFVYIYDPENYIQDPEAFSAALNGMRQKQDHQFSVYVLIN
jgi:hypothetical protein